MSSPLEVPSEIVQREPGDTDNTNPSTALLDSWKQIHGQLTKAVLISQEAIAAKKLQRRYWMEEICANLTEEGKLTHSSVWKRAVPSKKSTSKKAVTKKRKKTEQKSKEPKQKKAAAKKKKMEKQEPSSAEESKVVPPKKLTIKLKKPPKEVAPPQEEESVEQESQVTSDEEKRSESEMDSGKKLTYQDDRRYDDREESHESGFGQGPPWGPRQTDNYMIPNAYGRNHPNVQYPPYHRSMQEQHYSPHYYHSAGGMPPPEMHIQEAYPPAYAMPPPGSGRVDDDSSTEGE